MYADKRKDVYWIVKMAINRKKAEEGDLWLDIFPGYQNLGMQL